MRERAAGDDPAAETCREVGDRCRECDQCRDKQCRCSASGLRNCADRCRDPNADEDNCGHRGRRCGNDETCVKESGSAARRRPTDGGRRAEIGQRCDNGVSRCGGLRCAPGKEAFTACVLAWPSGGAGVRAPPAPDGFARA